jgi:hypothetical protein
MEVVGVYDVPHANEGYPAQQTNLYVGADGIAQQQLTSEQRNWMREMTGQESVRYHLLERESRRHSFMYAFGNEDVVLNLVFTAAVLVFVLLLWRVVVMRLWRSRS